MLVELRVNDLAVLAGVRLCLGPALNALTGETGSGKSLCVSALRLALGAPVDGSPVRAGADRAAVAAVFDDLPDAARARLAANGIPDDELLTLSREISVAGRGACRINGALVSQATLRGVAETLVEVTAQGESWRLLQRSRQRAQVDAAGGAELLARRRAMSAAVVAWRDAELDLARVEASTAAAADALAGAERLVDELGRTRLRPGEDHELAAERQRLRSVVALAGAAEGVRGACAGSEDAGGAADTLAAAATAVRGLEGLDVGIDSLAAACAEEEMRLRELAAMARQCVAALEPDAPRLALVEERLDFLGGVRRRHGGSLEAAIGRLEAARALLDAAGSGSQPADAAARVEERRAQAAVAAEALSGSRQRAASALEAAVTAQLGRLGLRSARFRVVLGRTPDPDGVAIDGERVACSAEGVDDVELRLATTADGVPIPIDEGISGGELSRLALALRAVGGVEAEEPPTLVLDEVDVGIGGETATRVGAALAEIGAGRQVLVVTHRAEIAARAVDHHRVTRGADAAGATVTTVVGEERELEVARLLSGRPTAAAIVRAQELLAEGGGRRLRTIAAR